MEEEFIRNQERLKPQEEKNEEERSKVDDLRYIGVGILGVYYSLGKYKGKYGIYPFLLFWTNQRKVFVCFFRGTPMSVGSLEEIIDDNHAIVSTSVGSEHYVSILSFVDKDQLEPGR